MSVKNVLLIVAVVGVVSIATWMVKGYLLRSSTNPSDAHRANSDAKHKHGKDAPPSGEPPVIDNTKPSGTAPEEMVWIPGGEFSMGSDEEMFTDARPIHRVGRAVTNVHQAHPAARV